jgi:ribose transport system ATP-binding protein
VQATGALPPPDALPRLGTDLGVALQGLTKSYGGVNVLTAVDLHVFPGEVHALLGANGAGKSTLIKCVGGAIRPDAGTIEVGGRRYSSLSPRGAREAGIAVIYQDYSLALSLSVTDNIFLGDELRRGLFIRQAAQRKRARTLMLDLGSDIPPDTLAADLRGADLQIVEIAKALRRTPTVLVLDEPTAALSHADATRLGERLKDLKQRRLPMLYVTHRLGEVFEVADRVTVLRDGRVVMCTPVCETNRDELVEAIIGPDRGGRPSRGGTQRRASLGADAGPVPVPLLSLQQVITQGIGPLDIDIRHGEILGIFGLLGAGRTEVLEGIFGVHGPIRGSLALDGEPTTITNPADAIAAGIALIPSDRRRKSLFAPLSALDNLLLPSMTGLATGPFRRRRREADAFGKLGRALRLRPLDERRPAVEFSGGNQQKLVVGRWLRRSEGMRLLLLDEPTEGVDVGARQDLYGALRDLVTDGRRSCVVTSSEPDEIAQLADRALVLSRGRVVAELTGPAITERALMMHADTAASA